MKSVCKYTSYLAALPEEERPVQASFSFCPSLEMHDGFEWFVFSPEWLDPGEECEKIGDQYVIYLRFAMCYKIVVISRPQNGKIEVKGTAKFDYPVSMEAISDIVKRNGKLSFVVEDHRVSVSEKVDCWRFTLAKTYDLGLVRVVKRDIVSALMEVEEKIARAGVDQESYGSV